jgi:hypothetical protein
VLLWFASWALQQGDKFTALLVLVLAILVVVIDFALSKGTLDA